jgi:hypothetical protein
MDPTVNLGRAHGVKATPPREGGLNGGRGGLVVGELLAAVLLLPLVLTLRLAGRPHLECQRFALAVLADDRDADLALAVVALAEV